MTTTKPLPELSHVEEFKLLKKLARYSTRYRTRSEAAGEGTRYPTVRECSRALKISQARVDDLIDANEEFDRLFWHTATPPKLGEMLVEYYGTALLETLQRPAAS